MFHRRQIFEGLPLSDYLDRKSGFLSMERLMALAKHIVQCHKEIDRLEKEVAVWRESVLHVAEYFGEDAELLVVHGSETKEGAAHEMAIKQIETLRDSYAYIEQVREGFIARIQRGVVFWDDEFGIAGGWTYHLPERLPKRLANAQSVEVWIAEP